jgi:hypothetical protein
VPILLPRALDVLISTPLAAGDYYPGDLLTVVMRLPDDSWRGLQARRAELVKTLAKLLQDGAVDQDLTPAATAFVTATPPR